MPAIPVRVEPLGVQAVLREIAEGGVFLETSDPVEQGTFIRVRIPDGAGRMIEPTGLVAWTRDVPDGHGPAGMGVEFHVLEPPEARRLVDLVGRALLAWVHRRRAGGPGGETPRS